jgi:hypothetical protein
MPTLKRLLQIWVLSACVMSPTVAFALDDMPVNDDGKVAASSLEEKGLDLWVPKPTYLSCTATSQCSPLWSGPVACEGDSNCSSSGLWVRCDSQTTYCPCMPSDVPSWCEDPVSFCDCWNQNHQYLSCRVDYCGTGG